MSGQAASSASSLLNLMNLFRGNSQTTSGGQETTQKVIDDKTLQGILKSAMESNQGLASVVGGQQQAGLYKSTTNTLLTNDLLSRLTTQAAALGAPTVTSKSPVTVKTPGLGANGLLSMGAMSLGKNAIDKALKGKSLSDMLGLGSSSAPASAAEISSFMSNSGAANLGGTYGADMVGEGTLGQITGEALGSALTGVGAESIGGGILAGSEFGVDALASLGTDYGAATMAEFGGTSAIGAISGAEGLGGLMATGTEAFIDAGGLAGLAEGGAAAVEAGGIGEAIAAAIAAWVICTELHSQGLLSDRLYKAGALRSLRLSEEVMAGYHLWAVPTVKLMRKYKWVTRFMLPIAVARNRQILGHKSILGYITMPVAEAVCWCLGKVVLSCNLKQDWRALNGRA